MKTSVILLACLVALVAVVAVPGERPGRGGAGESLPRPPVLCGSVESGTPCCLEIEAGPETIYDRGSLRGAEPGVIDAASYRYWQEPSGPVLYVYDDMQHLLCRVVHPESVRVLEERVPQ